MSRMLAGLIAVRLLLAAVIPNAWKTFDTFVELSTPITSFRRLLEGIYMADVLKISPYNGGPCNHSPLLLSFFSLIPFKFYGLTFSTLDVVAALQLADFVKSLDTSAADPTLVAAFYLFNPFSFLSTLAFSTNQISNALICCSLGAASKKRSTLAVILLALASVLSFYPLYLISCLLGLIQVFNPSSCKMRNLGKFIASFLVFLLLSFMPFMSWEFIWKQFGTHILLKDLTRANIGLWWYFFIEQFEFFRPFFLGAFQLFLVAFPIVFTIRFPKQPLFTLASLVGILATFKPYPEASDLGLYLTLLFANKSVFDLLEYKLVELLGLLYITVLARVFYYLWIYVGSGNANFYFAITLVYSIVMIIFLADSTWCAIRIDYDGGKATNLTQI